MLHETASLGTVEQHKITYKNAAARKCQSWQKVFDGLQGSWVQ